MLTILIFLVFEEQVECLNNRFFDKINLFSIFLASHVDAQRLGTFTFQISDLRQNKQRARVGVLVL